MSWFKKRPLQKNPPKAPAPKTESPMTRRAMKEIKESHRPVKVKSPN